MLKNTIILAWTYAYNQPVYSLRKTCAKIVASSADHAENPKVTHTHYNLHASNPPCVHSLVHTNTQPPSTSFQSDSEQLSTISTVPIKTIYLNKERKDK